ncbi:hypothetical protein L207DRAFT_481807 [Hyaloscypha variabilis F]|uniref:Uncharacterized protein n=1 Tax=Hyaloscypha variabilis (strain UAMH 11265 / GT02V1 / F) TaxID=1149755 RepID=A0A2J6S3W3_HYAVF|nr:hypothetical protein L207DRAFT_481807 [Hyaloscypha variabilis F]
MPVQRSLLGRPFPPMPPKRVAVLLSTIAVFAVFTLVFTLPNSIPSGPSLGRFTDHKIPMPKLPKTLSPSILNPFRQAAHAPPVQKNSTSGDASWYSNWNWMSPFSSSVTLDENRSLLPPLIDRPPIYTYYDHTLQKEKDHKDAENAVLVTWRRAWWAQGFKPIILSPAEAMNNPLYAELQMQELEPYLKTELARWLAWENMGTGILCHYLLLPMGSHEDPLLAFLRRGEYPQLTRFDHLGSGLFAGTKGDITAAVKQALSNKALKEAGDFIGAVSPETFKIDPKHGALAFYDTRTVKEKYSKIADEIENDGPSGLMMLNKLTISHLHTTWQNTFSKGIAVLKPQADHMTAAILPARKLAEFLTQCPSSPLPSSCPPNNPHCKPCVASLPLKITTPSVYRNTSDLYTIGTVPHPFTTALLSPLYDSSESELTIPWIRRKSKRDPWLTTITAELCGTGMSGAPRVVKFKDAVASQYGTAHSLWITAERDMPDDLDWYFGFTIPRNVTDKGESETPVPGPERKPNVSSGPRTLEPEVTEEEASLMKERALLKRAVEFGQARTPEDEKLRKAIEAWNLADTEAWRFARAFLERSRVERKRWEEEERKYAGGKAGAERGMSEGWGRWFDDR